MQAGSGTDRLLLQTVNDVLRAHEVGVLVFCSGS